MLKTRSAMRFCERCNQPIDGDPAKALELAGVRLEERQLSYEGRTVHLNAGAIVLLRRLMLFGCVSHDAFEALKKTESIYDQSTVYAYHLRKALEKIGAPIAVRTVYGWGYELVDLDGNGVKETDSLTGVAFGRGYGEPTGWQTGRYPNRTG